MNFIFTFHKFECNFEIFSISWMKLEDFNVFLRSLFLPMMREKLKSFNDILNVDQHDIVVGAGHFAFKLLSFSSESLNSRILIPLI